MRQRAKENEKETKRKRYAPRIIQGRTHTEIEKATESETTWRETDAETTRRVRETVTQIHTQRESRRDRGTCQEESDIDGEGDRSRQRRKGRRT